MNDLRRWITLVEGANPVIRYVADDSRELAPTSAAEYKRKSGEIVVRQRYRNNVPILHHEIGHALLDGVQPPAWVTAFQDDPEAWQQFLTTTVARSYQKRHEIADDWRDNPSAYDWIEAGPDLYMLDRLGRLDDVPLVAAILHRLIAAGQYR